YDNKGDLNEVVGNNGTWKRMTGPDGKDYWQNQEHPDLKWQGKMSVDKAGNLHYTPDDSHSSAWIFMRDGRDVPVSRGNHASANTKRDLPNDTATGQQQPRPPIVVDTSIPVPRDLFDREGTPSTVKDQPSKPLRK